MQQNYYNPYGNNQYQFSQQDMQQDYQLRLDAEKENKEILKIGIALGLSILGYLLAQTIASTFLTIFNLYDLYKSSVIFQNCFSVIGISFFSVFLPFGIMALINKKKYTTPLIPTKKVGFMNGSAWVFLGMAGCILANYFVNFIIQIVKGFGYQLTQGESLEPNSIFACITSLISIAVIPPICEEFAMRCCGIGLLRKYGKGFAVFAISIVFGLLHGNVIQFLFAFLVGMILGYITIITDNIIPAICIHAFNNGMSVVNSIVAYATNTDTANTITMALYIIWFVLGVGGFIYLSLKGQFKKHKEVKTNPYKASFGKKLLLLLPGLALPIFYLVITTIQTIEKI